MPRETSACKWTRIWRHEEVVQTMDVLKARKRAQQRKEEEKESEKRAGGLAGASAEDSGKKRKKKSSSGKKTRVSGSVSEAAGVEKAQGAPGSKAVKEEGEEKAFEEWDSAREEESVSTGEIPVGAQAPEEMELTPDDLASLFGTQDMPELPAAEMPMDTGPECAGVETGTSSPPGEKVKGEHEAPAERIPPAREKPQPRAEREATPEYAPGLADGTGDEEEEDRAAEAPLEFLSFMLGDEEYALPLSRISEIIKPRPITDVPRCKEFVLGIIFLRGAIIPVFDLLARLNLGKVTWSRSSRIVVVRRSDGELVGLATDSVEDVVRVFPGDIEPPPPAMGTGVETQFLEGVGRAEESRRTKFYAEEAGKEEDQEKKLTKKKLVILLNLDKVASL